MIYRNKLGTMELPYELYAYLRNVSFERAFKLPPGHTEFKEFKGRMYQLETAFRNTIWGEAPLQR